MLKLELLSEGWPRGICGAATGRIRATLPPTRLGGNLAAARDYQGAARIGGASAPPRQFTFGCASGIRISRSPQYIARSRRCARSARRARSRCCRPRALRRQRPCQTTTWSVSGAGGFATLRFPGSTACRKAVRTLGEFRLLGSSLEIEALGARGSSTLATRGKQARS